MMGEGSRWGGGGKGEGVGWGRGEGSDGGREGVMEGCVGGMVKETGQPDCKSFQGERWPFFRKQPQPAKEGGVGGTRVRRRLSLQMGTGAGEP